MPDDRPEGARRHDPGGFKVQRARCSTCIYRRDMHWDLECLEDEVRDPHMGFKSHRACHHARAGDVCCRGFWDHHRNEFALGQIAQRLGVVQFVMVDDLGIEGSRDG